MKTIIILVLAAALVGGAFLSKPSQANFNDYINGQTQPAQSQSLKTSVKGLLGNILNDASAQIMTYDDHGLWATEDQNGQAKYFGAFAHWWPKGQAATATK